MKKKDKNVFSSISISSSKWSYGAVMCKLTKTILEMGSLLSSGFFQLITTERYFLVVYGARASRVKVSSFNFLVHTSTRAPDREKDTTSPVAVCTQTNTR